MKKAIIPFLFAVFGFVAVQAAPGGGKYTVNDQAIEQVFANSKTVSGPSLAANATENPFLSNDVSFSGAKSGAQFSSGGKNFVAALLLDFFLGALGIHRLYLGTKTMTWVGYILTCGGIFGIVPFVDLIVLIVHNEDISPYVDNPKFFMWANG